VNLHCDSPLAVIGGSVVDELIKLRSPIRRGGEYTVHASTFTPGGKAPNTAVRAAVMGAPVHLITRFGDDQWFAWLRERYEEHTNLHVTAANVGGTSAHVTVMVDPDGERTMVLRLPEGGLDPEPTPYALGTLRNSKVVWIVVNDEEKREQFRQAAIGAIRGIQLQDLEREVALGHRWEFSVGSIDDLDSEPTADFLRAAGLRLCVITEGGEGGRWWTPENGWDRYETVHVDHVVDTCGAGDAFLGGLLAGLASELDYREALRYASTSGAQAVTETGAWPTITHLAVA
jgi:ribokinase